MCLTFLVMKQITVQSGSKKWYQKNSATGFMSTVPATGTSFCRAMLCKRGLCRHAVSVCVSVRQVHEFCHIFKIFSPSSSQTILVFPYQMSRWYSDGDPPNGDIKCRWGRQKSWFWANTSAINSAATDHGKLVALVAGKWQSLLMVGDDDKVHDKKYQRYAEDNGAAFNCIQPRGKSEV